MARDLDLTIQAHQQQLRDENPWIWLYEFEVPTTPETRYRITNYTEDITFGVNTDGDPIPYYAFPCRHGEIEQSKEGDVPSITVTVANATRELGLSLDEHDGLVGQRAVVRLVNVTTLDMPESGIRWDARIRRSMVTPEVVSVEISSYNLTQSQFPPWRYMRNSCSLHYGGAVCGYPVPGSPGETVGTGFSFCQKTYAACTQRGEDEAARGVTVRHPFRFGAFRGIPGS